MDKLSKLEQQLCFEVYKASSNFTKMYVRVLEPFGLTFTQYLVLLVLWEDDRLMAKEIGERLGLGTGTLNPIISRLEAGDWLQKEQSMEDKRATVISLTGKAKKNQPLIETAVSEKLVSCNFIEDTSAISLMKDLKKLNAYFQGMNL